MPRRWEANAAMRAIVRRDTGENYEEFLRGLAKASGIATPTREDLARLDRKRKKRMSNREWKSPADEDARIAKMKDGRTHLAHNRDSPCEWGRHGSPCAIVDPKLLIRGVTRGAQGARISAGCFRSEIGA